MIYWPDDSPLSLGDDHRVTLTIRAAASRRSELRLNSGAALLRRSSHSGDSPKFALKEFSEVRIAPIQPLSASPAEIGTPRVLS
jgi:hypothetical protein